jgi:hypothetical protein
MTYELPDDQTQLPLPFLVDDGEELKLKSQSRKSECESERNVMQSGEFDGQKQGLETFGGIAGKF